MNARRCFFAIVLILTAILAAPPDSHPATLVLNNSPAQVCFSPDGGCTGAIVDAIKKARSEVLVLAYSFTSAPIAKALVDANKRGIKIQVVLDKSQRSEKYTSANFLANAKIPTFIDSKHAIQHNKVIIIDRETVITGSFNFTKSAEERNAENLLIIRSADLVREYIKDWQRHREHSEPMSPRY